MPYLEGVKFLNLLRQKSYVHRRCRAFALTLHDDRSRDLVSIGFVGYLFVQGNHGRVEYDAREDLVRLPVWRNVVAMMVGVSLTH